MTQTGTLERVDREQTGARKALATPFFVAACLVSFIIIFSVTLAQSLSYPSIALSALFDSCQYLYCSEQVLTAIKSVMAHPDMATIKSAVKSLAEPIMLNGPVLPLLGATYFLILQATPSLTDTRAALALQALIHASGAVLLTLLTLQLSAKPRLSLAAGFAWGLYPAAVIGAGKFMSETLSSTLVLGFFLTLILLLKRQTTEDRAFDPISFSLAVTGGVVASLLMLVKPALAVAAALACSVYLFQIFGLESGVRRALVTLIALTLGGVLVLAPWLWFSKEATGRLYLTPQRMPTYNIAVGLNPETDGWGAIPETKIASQYKESKSSLEVLCSFLRQDPAGETLRMARKISRLSVNPWNDCRFSLFFVPANLQAYWHQILIALGLIGMALAWIRSGKWLSVPDKIGTTFLLSALTFIAAHALYLPFVANARYGFTAMPLIIIFALFAADAILSRPNKLKTAYALLAVTCFVLSIRLPGAVPGAIFSADPGVQTALHVILTLSILAAFALTACLAGGLKGGRSILAPALSLFLICSIPTVAECFAPDWNNEWIANLSPGMKAERTVRLPATRGDSNWAALIVDGGENVENARFTLNGRELGSRPVSLIHASGTNELPNNYKVFSAVMTRFAPQLRQWFVVEVPLDWLKFNALNTLSVEPGHNSKKVAIFGSNSALIAGSKEPLPVPSFNLFSATRLLNDPLKNDPRLCGYLPANVREASCHLNSASGRQSDDLSAEPGVQRGQYRMFLLLGSESRHQRLAVTQTLRNKTDITLLKGDTLHTPFAVPRGFQSVPYIRITIRGTVPSYSGPEDKPISVSIKEPTLLGNELPLTLIVDGLRRTDRGIEVTSSAVVGGASFSNPISQFGLEYKSDRPVMDLEAEVTPLDGHLLSDSTARYF